MSTTLSNKHVSLQLRGKSPVALGAAVMLAFIVLLVSELLLPHFLDFKFHPKNGMRPIIKERIHKIAMISLAVLPVISSLYLDKTQQRLLRRFCTNITLKGTLLFFYCSFV